MKIIFFLIVLPVLVGASLGLACYFIMKRRPTALPWPLYFFFALLGGAACNTAAVHYTGTWAIFSGRGGFLGDGFSALFNGTVLALASLAGMAVSFTALRLRTGKRPCAPAAWGWGWLISQSVLNILIFLLGLLPFQVFADRPGLPLWLYLVMIATATLALGTVFGLRWGRAHSPLFPLLGMALLSALGLYMAWCMLREAEDLNWGLSLIQTGSGLWYSRLCLPSAILLGDYGYRWDITPARVYLFTLAPHVLFATGYLTPKLFRRGSAQ